MTTVNIKWGREKFQLQIVNKDDPLSVLRNMLTEKTQLDQHDFKLIHAGAVMKDDNAPISSYRIKPNSRIVLMPISAPAEAHRTEQTQRPTEQATRTRIAEELAHLHGALSSDLSAFTSVSTPNMTEHARLGELLLQMLLRLDALVPEPGWTEAREDRRKAVYEVQEALDRLDAAWKAAGSK